MLGMIGCLKLWTTIPLPAEVDMTMCFKIRDFFVRSRNKIRGRGRLTIVLFRVIYEQVGFMIIRAISIETKMGMFIESDFNLKAITTLDILWIHALGRQNITPLVLSIKMAGTSCPAVATESTQYKLWLRKLVSYYPMSQR